MNVLVAEQSLQDIANAIREKNGTEKTYKPSQMGDAVRAIETGEIDNEGILLEFLSDGLTTFTIPKEATKLRKGVFSGMINLESILVEDGNNAYFTEDGVLYGVSENALIAYPSNKPGEVFSLPSNVTSILTNAFSGCNNLKKITIHDKVSNLANIITSDCDEDLEVMLILSADKLVNGGDPNNFGYYPIVCNSITSVVVPEDATFLDVTAFDKLKGINTIYFYATNCDIEIFNANSKTYTSVETAFSRCKDLKKIVINGPVAIQDYLFINSKVQTVEIGNSVETIGSTAFYKVSSLENILLSDNLKSIGSYAFYNTGLKTVTIPNSVTSIKSYAFQLCYDLKEVTIGTGVTRIEDHMFGSCTSLEKVTILGSPNYIDSYAFNGCPNTLEIYGYEGTGVREKVEALGFTFVAL